MKLTELKTRGKAVVKEVTGGDSVRHRLEALGIKPGIEITVISSHFWGGPVTVRVGKASISIGRGMADRIIVETNG